MASIHQGSVFDVESRWELCASAPATADDAAIRHVARSEGVDRKARGQFFTPPAVAEFMASLFDRIPDRCRLLDAGAGVGALTAALCNRIIHGGHAQTIEVVAYELDSSAIALLERTLSQCKSSAARAGCTLTSEIRIWDFVTDTIRESGPLFSTLREPFDLAIMNPPYFKLKADSAHARLARTIGPTQPNIYSLFMAIAVEQLRPGGELVAITPRSFCNGLYFRGFRKWLIERAELLQIHLFTSRKDAFREEGVLQENVITHFRRRDPREESCASIVVSRNVGRIFDAIGSDVLPWDRVIDNSCGDNLICIPDRAEDAD